MCGVKTGARHRCFAAVFALASVLWKKCPADRPLSILAELLRRFFCGELWESTYDYICSITVMDAWSQWQLVYRHWNCSTPSFHSISITFNIMSIFFFYSFFILVHYIILKFNISGHPLFQESPNYGPRAGSGPRRQFIRPADGTWICLIKHMEHETLWYNLNLNIMFRIQGDLRACGSDNVHTRWSDKPIFLLKSPPLITF